jgi:hypothetical protein
MLAASMSKDKYMPRMFNVRGDRLGYSNSIITLNTPTAYKGIRFSVLPWKKIISNIAQMPNVIIEFE